MIHLRTQLIASIAATILTGLVAVSSTAVAQQSPQEIQTLANPNIKHGLTRQEELAKATVLRSIIRRKRAKDPMIILHNGGVEVDPILVGQGMIRTVNGKLLILPNAMPTENNLVQAPYPLPEQPTVAEALLQEATEGQVIQTVKQPSPPTPKTELAQDPNDLPIILLMKGPAELDTSDQVTRFNEPDNNIIHIYLPKKTQPQGQ